MSTLNPAALGSLSSPGEAGSSVWAFDERPAPFLPEAAPALDIAGALDLFRPERRRRDSAERPFVYQRIGAYALSWRIVAMGGCIQLLADAALLEIYLHLR